MLFCGLLHLENSYRNIVTVPIAKEESFTVGADNLPYMRNIVTVPIAKEERE